ncbi:choice-of-anchor I family protein [Methylomonas rhizoryzae]|uniref:choice-of-anchor I family protein n=1 Tax=Methylomonas rhizoryzae TaxID=2608981 RepID=UPI0012324BD4|nr:choice-of-anchor I family protein [Methylomonas rhizoryzae]
MKLLPLAAAIAAALVSAGAAAADFQWSHQWTFNHTAANGSNAMGSEIVAYDALNDRLWIAGTDANQANIGQGGIDVLDLSGNLVQSFSTAALGGINSVALSHGQAAVAITAPTKTDPGVVRFYDAADYSLQGSITVGANPDAVTYTPDGSRLLVANEGEPSSYSIGPAGDPEGSVSIIDTSTFAVQTAGFSGFNADADALTAAGVRLTGPNATVAQDLEPEYIAVSRDGSTAFATLQEANAVAIIDIASATVTDIKSMGLKDHSLPGNGLDASDRDGSGNNPLNGNIQNWNVQGLYMPDGIASFSQGGKQYYLTANEGDSRADWPGGNDEIRVGSADIDPALRTALDAAHGTDWQSNNDKLSRLTVSTSGDNDGDGDLDRLQVFGARSFSILDADGNMVFDSGDQLEQIIKAQFPSLWDDGRSDNKGPEPESAVVGKVDGRELLFLGLERSNAVMVWDLTDLSSIAFLDMLFTSGDVGPEGLIFFSNAQGSYLAVANEVSETTSLYKVSAVPLPGALWLFGSMFLTWLGLREKREA